MNGPEHFRASEFAIENAKDAECGSNKEHFFLAVAQVHATLALAAATALNSAEGIVFSTDQNAWFDVASAAWCVKHQRYFVAGKCTDCTEEAETADDEFLPDPLVFAAAEYYASADAGEAFRLAERQKDAEMMWRYDEPAEYAAQSDVEQQATQDDDTEERAL